MKYALSGKSNDQSRCFLFYPLPRCYLLNGKIERKNSDVTAALDLGFSMAYSSKSTAKKRTRCTRIWKQNIRLVVFSPCQRVYWGFWRASTWARMCRRWFEVCDIAPISNAPRRVSASRKSRVVLSNTWPCLATEESKRCRAASVKENAF